MPYKDKVEVRGHIKDGSGANKVFSGRVKFIRDTFAFIGCGVLNIDLYAALLTENGDILKLSVGEHLKFTVGFSLMGPVAENVQKSML